MKFESADRKNRGNDDEVNCSPRIHEQSRRDKEIDANHTFATCQSSNKWQILFSSIVSSICHRLLSSLSQTHTATEPLGQSHRQQFYFYFDEKLECDERAKQILYHIKIRLTSN